MSILNSLNNFRFFLSIAVISSLFVYTKIDEYPTIERFESENYFFDPKTRRREQFPSIDGRWSVHLSVIVPAYNEEKRLPLMLDECLDYLKNREKSGLTYEIIIVSDGSKDRTVDIAHFYAERHKHIRVLKLEKNRGKGGAVRLGVLSARGSVILFADADGATKFGDLEKLESSMEKILNLDLLTQPDRVANSRAVICGSRAQLDKETNVERTFIRLFLSYCVKFFVRLIYTSKVKDTQCGFKLFTRESAKILFKTIHMERWAFDIEMLYVAEMLEMPIAEVGVNWTEMEGSKMMTFSSWILPAKDLITMFLRYKFKSWTIDKSLQPEPKHNLGSFYKMIDEINITNIF